MSFARMKGADLSKANLSEANLSFADLRVARLCGAVVDGAELREVHLAGADLSDCRLAGTVLAALDLSEVRGLESVIHRGASSIATETLFLSRGKIPEGFLRGCGLSDWEVEAAKLYDRNSPNQIIDIQQRVFELRAGSPLQIGSLFISYTHDDSVFVDALEEKLDAKGIRFWRYIHDAPAGPFDKIIDRAIRLNPTVVVVLSEHSVESRWVEYEANLADKLSQELGRDTLCPIALDDAWKNCRWSGKLRTQIEKYNILPFNDWQDSRCLEEMFRRLVEGLSIFYRPEKAP